MDLVAGVRKEGSRGGRADFKWEDVKNDQHRENYLGHSLMAPVGRWQKNRDLSWYAKGDNSEAAQSAANARAEEIRRIKEAEQDALSEALGYPVMPKPKPLEKVEASEVERAIKETGEDEEGDDARGVGFGGVTGLAATKPKAESEMMPAQSNGRGGLDGAARDAIPMQPRRRSRSRDRERDRDADRDADRKGRRSRSRDRDGNHRHRGRGDEEKRSHRRHRSSSRDRDRRHWERSRLRSTDRRMDSERVHGSRRDRSHSPQARRRDRSWERSRDRNFNRRH